MLVKELIQKSMIKWMDAQGPEADIVISSRVRLARNLRMVPFPHLLDDKKGKELINMIKTAWEKSDDPVLRAMEMVDLDQLDMLERQILVEKHLISPGYIQEKLAIKALLLNNDGSISLMINEEDHLRIQCLLPGLQVQESYKLAQNIDDKLEEHLDYAFDDRRGYLTSCPTNVGTGARISVMLHLPAITVTGQVSGIFANLGQLGMTVRGLYGEGTQFVGNIYQLSNQVTLGQSEEDICNNIWVLTKQVVEQERLMREKLKKEMKQQLEDRVYRAYGTLSNARLMNSNEALSLLSELRLGVDMGIIDSIKVFSLNELIVAIRPAHLQKKAVKEMGASERDFRRAEVIREKLLRA